MSRKTKQNKITSPELIAQINPENIRLMNDFLNYLNSMKRSLDTIAGYKNDLHIFFVWNLLNNNNKFFIDLTKRELVSYQNYITNDNENSPARVRRLKSVLSSMSNYIQNILDDEFDNFKPIIKKLENPINEKVREKTVLEDNQIDYLLNYLVEKKQYQKACAVALAVCSGSRKSELTRFKVDYFKDENIIFGSLYKTPEKMLTKGRNRGKFIFRYILATKFKYYLDLWLKEREELGIDSEWLLVDKYDKNYGQIKISTLNSWAITFSKILDVDYYWHSNRHYFCTLLLKQKLPNRIIKDLIGWADETMISVYSDLETEDEFGDYFDENGIKEIEVGSIKNL